MVSYFSRRKFLIVFLVLITFSISLFEFSKNRSDLLFGQVNAEIEKCGCSTCHTIELNRCGACHDSQLRKERSNDSTISSKEQTESVSTAQENNYEPQGSQPSSIVKQPSSELDEPYDNSEEPRKTFNKPKNQKGLG